MQSILNIFFYGDVLYLVIFNGRNLMLDLPKWCTLTGLISVPSFLKMCVIVTSSELLIQIIRLFMDIKYKMVYLKRTCWSIKSANKSWLELDFRPDQSNEYEINNQI